MRRKLSSFISVIAVSACIMSGCGGQAGTSPEPAAEGQTEQTAAEEQTGADTENLSESGEVQVPEINEDFTGNSSAAESRGGASVETVDDDKASDGRALKISNRTQNWEGANFKAELFRGNTIDVEGSFRSANANARVSVQYSINSSESYNYVFTVNTSEDKYTSGKGSFIIPPNCSKIYVYVESDNLGDIYCDYLTVKVKGDYTYYEKAQEVKLVDTSGYPSLKELYKDDFKIGMAIGADMFKSEEYTKLVKAQFDSVTPGNSFKPDSLLDREKNLSDPENYNEAPAVRFDNVIEELEFAKENGMTVRGHTLLWHSQTPDWLFYKDYDVNGELADRELMLKRMENYIKTVVQWADEKYPGLVSSWDVVNEAVDDNKGMRESLWYQTVGEDYVQKAFEYARAYAPADVKLFYNDYNAYQARKQLDIIAMLKPVAEAGNIDGMGMQSHINTDISIESFISAMERYNKQLGVEVQVTELDIGRKDKDGWEKVQGMYYQRLFTEMRLARKRGCPLTSVTIWGIADDVSWKAAEFPLPFNADLSRKPAFDGMVTAAGIDLDALD